MENTIKNAGKAKRKKFNASLSFSHRPPYDPLLAERVPVLQAFQCALASYYINRNALVSRSLWKKLGALLNPATLPFRAAECGVYTGSSLIACASMVRDIGLPFRMIGLDTFSGFPPLSETDRNLAPEGSSYLSTRAFTDTSLEAVQKKLVEEGLDRNVELRKGLFSETLPILPHGKYHFVNIDCDLYEPHIECLEYFYPRMATGGIIFFDDYHSVEYPMAAKAVNDFMRDKPEALSHLRFGDDGPNRTKSFFVKY